MSAEEAYALLSNRPWESAPPFSESWSRSRLLSDVRKGPWDESRSDVAAVTKVFSSEVFKDRYAQVVDAIETGWRAPVTWSALTSDPASDWNLWLLARSRWVRERLDDADSAVDDWLMVLRLARRASTEWWISNAVEEMMYSTSESCGSIDTLQLAIAVHETFGSVLANELLAEDILMTHAWLEGFYVREDGEWLVLSERPRYAAHAPHWGPVAAGSAPASRVWNLASPLFHDLATARKAVDDYFALLDGVTTLADCREAQSFSGTKRFGEHLTALVGFPHYPENWVSHHVSDLWSCYTARCKLEAGLTMLALREYHRQHGDYPDTLDRLVPEYLPRLPLDYGDGETLRYRLTDDGYVLYSVGDNGRDDGGDTSREGPSRPRGLDTVFSNARRPESRAPATSH